MSNDRLVFDTDEVEVIDYIEHKRYVPRKVYELATAAQMLSEDEVEKVKRYIERISNKRVKPWFPKPMTEKDYKNYKKAEQKREKKLERWLNSTD